MFGQTETMSCVSWSLTLAQEGLGLEAPHQLAASGSITASHVESITTHRMFMVAGEKSTEELRRRLPTVKIASAKSRMESIDATLSPDVLQLITRQGCKFVAHCSPSCRSGSSF